MNEPLSKRQVRRLLDAARAQDPEEAVHDRYELRHVLGRGGMGIVYEAFDKELGRRVAIKILNAESGLSDSARKRFAREAKAAGGLIHPHIAAVYDATESFIVMQYVDGSTLGEHTFEHPRELVSIVRDAALAIHYAHEQGIIHRDLKPANLMVQQGERPHAFVMDFGLAMEREVDVSLSRSGCLIGTPAYMAPEQAEGDRERIGPETDVYGLGATLYSCLAGKAPFEDSDIYRMMRRVIEEDPPPLGRDRKDIDRDLQTIVHKCLRKEPAHRYPSALALASDLDRWSRGEPVEARAPSLAYRLRRFASRRQGAIAVGATAALLSFLIVLPFLMKEATERETADRVFALSRLVDRALDDASLARAAGSGYEKAAHRILEDAIEECRFFLKETDVGHAWLFLGQLLRAQHRLEDALESLDRAEESLEGNRDFHLERGLVLSSLYRTRVPVTDAVDDDPWLETYRQRADRDLRRALEVPPTVPTTQTLFAEAQLAFVGRELPSAIAKHREVIERDSTHLEAHLALTKLYFLTGRDELALWHTSVASDLYRGHRPSYVAREQTTFETKEAIQPERDLLALDGTAFLFIDFTRSLKLDSGNVPALGMKAQQEIRQAVRSFEDGDIEGGVRFLKEAIRHYESAVDLDPDSALTQVNLGACRAWLSVKSRDSSETQGLSESALENLDHALERNPRLAVARYNRAVIFRHRAKIAQFTLQPALARDALTLAHRDARLAVEIAGPDHPHLETFQALAHKTAVNDGP